MITVVRLRRQSVGALATAHASAAACSRSFTEYARARSGRSDPCSAFARAKNLVRIGACAIANGNPVESTKLWSRDRAEATVRTRQKLARAIRRDFPQGNP